MRKISLFILVAFMAFATLQAQRSGPFRCTVTVATATTLTAVGGDCVAGQRESLYITGITASSTVISSTAADSMLTLKSGTGAACGTGTAVVWLAQALAFTTVVDHFDPPIRIPRNSDLCWIMSAAGTKSWVITGYIGP